MMHSREIDLCIIVFYSCVVTRFENRYDNEDLPFSGESTVSSKKVVKRVL